MGIETIIARIEAEAAAKRMAADAFAAECEAHDYSVMDAQAVASVQAWRRQPYGWTGLTNGQWMAKVSSEQLKAEYARLFRIFGLPLSEAGSTRTAITIAHDHYAQADRIAYELLRRGEWLN